MNRTSSPYRFLAAPKPPGKMTASWLVALSLARSVMLPLAMRADSARTFLPTIQDYKNTIRSRVKEKTEGSHGVESPLYWLPGLLWRLSLAVVYNMHLSHIGSIHLDLCTTATQMHQDSVRIHISEWIYAIEFVAVIHAGLKIHWSRETISKTSVTFRTVPDS